MSRTLLSFIFSLCAFCAFAGGPFFVDKGGSGVPIVWKNNTIRWMADPGPLNPKIDNSKAISWASEVLRIWKEASLTDATGADVQVVDITAVYLGNAAQDITASNYLSVINSAQQQGIAIIIFDSDGIIIDEEIGEGAHKYVVGFASPIVQGGPNFAGGVVVLNGLFVDGDNKETADVSEKEFKAAFLHEVGHLLNLDHTQANIEALERAREGDLSLLDEIPTMFPVLYSDSQLSLQVDDVVALAEQYPSVAYLNNFCRITGELIDTDGKGFQGADVVGRALSADNEWSDVRTIISGVLYPAGSANGNYSLGGLIPGRNYVVGYRAVDEMYTGGSSIAPFDPPRTDIIAGTIQEEVIACSGGGLSIEMSVSEVTKIGGGTSGSFDATQPSGGCSLIPTR